METQIALLRQQLDDRNNEQERHQQATSAIVLASPMQFDDRSPEVDRDGGSRGSPDSLWSSSSSSANPNPVLDVLGTSVLPEIRALRESLKAERLVWNDAVAQYARDARQVMWALSAQPAANSPPHVPAQPPPSAQPRASSAKRRGLEQGLKLVRSRVQKKMDTALRRVHERVRARHVAPLPPQLAAFPCLHSLSPSRLEPQHDARRTLPATVCFCVSRYPPVPIGH
jgi:hypothetical protein